MAPSRKDASSSKPRRPPATTPEARENQMVSLAIDLAEKQLAEGTASSQVITHYLKLATSREQLEKEKLSRENELLQAKVQNIHSMANVEALYKDALNAMKTYSGQDPEDEYYED